MSESLVVLHFHLHLIPDDYLDDPSGDPQALQFVPCAKAEIRPMLQGTTTRRSIQKMTNRWNKQKLVDIVVYVEIASKWQQLHSLLALGNRTLEHMFAKLAHTAFCCCEKSAAVSVYPLAVPLTKDYSKIAQCKSHGHGGTDSRQLVARTCRRCGSKGTTQTQTLCVPNIHPRIDHT